LQRAQKKRPFATQLSQALDLTKVNDMTIKFDNTDRQHVVDVIQKHIGSKLTRITKETYLSKR